MTQVAKLEADLVANTSRFESGLNRANRALTNSSSIWSKSLKQTDTSFAALGRGVSALVGTFGVLSGVVTGALGSGFVLMAKGAIDAASAINDTAARLQITTTELQRYQYAAKLSGVENDLLETAFTKLQSKIASGDFAYKNASEGFESIADAVKNAASDTERAAIVNDAFGAKLGAKLLPVLADGAAGLRDLGDQAQRTGNIIGSDTIQRADDLGDALGALGDTLTKNFQSGILEQIASETGNVKAVYEDPAFAENIKSIGSAFGGLSVKGAELLAVLVKIPSSIAQLNEAAKRASANVDAGFFSFLDRVDGRTSTASKNAQDQARALQNIYAGQQAGPGKPGTVTGTGNFGPTKPFTFSADSKKAENAAKQAQQEAQRREQTTQSILNGLRLESEQINIQTTMYGQKESAIARAQKQLQLNNQLTQSGITLTNEQQKQVERYLDTIEKQSTLQAEQEKQTDRIKEKEKNRQQALDQLGATISSSFEDAIVNGEKLSDVLDGLLADIAKLLLRKNITEPLFNSLTSDGGIFDSIGKSLFSGLPSFAVGTSYVPHDMTANIHKGEMIIPAAEAAALRSGGGGSGGEITINVVNNAGAKVSASSRSTGSGTDIQVLIDQAVADNINKPGSKTNQAMTAFGGRTLVKR